MTLNISQQIFCTYAVHHSRDTLLCDRDVNERKTWKIRGLW